MFERLLHTKNLWRYIKLQILILLYARSDEQLNMAYSLSCTYFVIFFGSNQCVLHNIKHGI